MILAVVLMCSFALPTYAADGTEDLVTAELDAVFQRGYGDVVNDYSFMTYNYKYNGKNYTIFSCREYSSDEVISLLMLTEPFSLNSNHEYHLEYEVYHVTANNDILHSAFLKFYDNNGEVIKEQQLVSVSGVYSEPISVSVDFKPDVSDIEGGYTCRLEFYTVSAGIENFGYSEKITFIDKDDDSGWFQKIINKIEETISNIKEIPSKINQKLTELKESITNAFVELKENLIEGLKGLFVPSDGFFEEKKAELELFLEDHFGILWTAPNIMISTIEQLLTMSPEEPSITMPAIQFTWEDELITLTEPMTVHFNDYIGEGTPLETFYNFYRIFVTIILIFLFINYCLKKYHYIFGKDGEAVEH